MRLNAIFAIEKDDTMSELYEGVLKGLQKYRNEHGYFKREEVFDEIRVSRRYATTIYKGKIKDDIELTELELSMICDNGYSHFGGSSVIHRDKTFVVEIYVD